METPSGYQPKDVGVNAFTEVGRQKLLAGIRQKREAKGWIFQSYQDKGIDSKACFLVPPGEAKRSQWNKTLLGIVGGGGVLVFVWMGLKDSGPESRPARQMPETAQHRPRLAVEEKAPSLNSDQVAAVLMYCARRYEGDMADLLALAFPEEYRATDTDLQRKRLMEVKRTELDPKVHALKDELMAGRYVVWQDTIAPDYNTKFGGFVTENTTITDEKVTKDEVASIVGSILPGGIKWMCWLEGAPITMRCTDPIKFSGIVGYSSFLNFEMSEKEAAPIDQEHFKTEIRIVGQFTGDVKVFHRKYHDSDGNILSSDSRYPVVEHVTVEFWDRGKQQFVWKKDY